MTKEGSALRVSVLLCMKAVHSKNILHVTNTTAIVVIVPVRVDTSRARVAISRARVRKAGTSQDKAGTSSVKVDTSLARGAISHARVRKVVISQGKEDTNHVRVAISHARDKVADISSARVDIRSLMASPTTHIRRDRASIRQTTIRMPSTA
jgi:hypothetical protein